MEGWTLRVEECLQKYLKPLKFLGIFPFINSANGLKICKISLILSSFISLMLLTCCISYLFYFENSTSENHPKVLRYLRRILLLSMPITQIVTLISLVIHKSALSSVFSTIKRIGHKLPGLNPNISLQFPIFFTLFILMSSVIFGILLEKEGGTIQRILFHVLTFFNNCTLHLYTITVLIIKSCFQCIGQSLKIRKKIIKNLNIFLDSYDLLLNCCDDLNKCFGLLLLFIMTTNFCILTTYFFLVLKKDENFYVTAFEFSWALFYSFQVLHLAWVTNSTVEKAEEIKGTLIRYSYEEANRFSFLNVMLLIQNKALTFTACGLFDINYRMVCSMTAGITTYIVVIIQMGVK